MHRRRRRVSCSGRQFVASRASRCWRARLRRQNPGTTPGCDIRHPDRPRSSRSWEILRCWKAHARNSLRGFRTPTAQAIVLGGPAANLKPDGYELKTVDGKIVITGADDRGVLYGAFALLRKVALGEPIANLDEKSEPRVPVRWVNHWDNLDGSIERGYGGRSIFWDNGTSRADLTRVNDYGRMLASLGINGASINNVNVNPRILAPDFLPEIVRIANTLRPWGVRMVLSVDFGSPQKVGGLDTFDPLDPKVIAWWKAKTDEIYRAVPDLGGFIIKADSEGRVGPVGVWTDACRCGQCCRPRAEAARRPDLLSRLRLRQQDGLAQSEERPCARRRRQFPLARRQVRRQRRDPDQERAHRFSGARAGFAAVRDACRRPTRRSSCRSRRSTWARLGTPCSWCRCGKKRSISTCASTTARRP